VPEARQQSDGFAKQTAACYAIVSAKELAMRARHCIWLVGLMAGLLATVAQAGRGEFDTNVLSAQRNLSAVGYLPGTSDGIMGPKTRAALIDFQGDHALPQTGEVDTATRQALGLDGDANATAAPAHLVKLQEFLAQQGDYKGEVDGRLGRLTWRSLQGFLKEKGYYSGNVDGLAGRQTRAAIRAWQQQLSVATTGVLDPATVTAAVSLVATAGAPAATDTATSAASGNP